MTVRVNIRDREELVYLLGEAAAFEHTVMCSYLYALWTLKHPGEGLSDSEGAMVSRWRQTIRSVVLDEMVHLTLVNNILSAVGAAAQYRRPEFPVQKGEFPANVVFELTRFDEAALEHFMYLERPEGIQLEDGAGFVHPHHFERVVKTHLVTPTPHDYSSQGELYREIASGIVQLAQKLGEDVLFCGHGTAQVDGAHFGIPGLFVVDSVLSATRAIEEIIEQGEGAPEGRSGSHYERFREMLSELRDYKTLHPHFEPAWPAARNPWLNVGIPEDAHHVISSEPARHVVDLGNSIYGLMLKTFVQVFSPHPLPSGLREELSSAASGLMQVLSVVGETAARLTEGNSGKTAGLSFQVAHTFGALVQHSAGQILGERASELAEAAYELGRAPELAESRVFTSVSSSLASLAEALIRVGAEYGRRPAPAEGRDADLKPPSSRRITVVEDKAPTSSVRPTSTVVELEEQDINTAQSDDITIFFNPERCIHSRHCVLGAPKVFLAGVEGAWLHPEASTADHLAEIAHLCPSGAITYKRLDGAPQEGPPEVNALRVRENGPLAVHAEIEIEGHGRMYRATLCRCGHSQRKPFCDGAHASLGFVATGEPETEVAEAIEARHGRLHIRPVEDGPNEVHGNLELLSGTGRRLRQLRSCRLCRCGGSQSKPYCDGTHARIGFKSR